MIFLSVDIGVISLLVSFLICIVTLIPIVVLVMALWSWRKVNKMKIEIMQSDIEKLELMIENKREKKS